MGHKVDTTDASTGIKGQVHQQAALTNISRSYVRTLLEQPLITPLPVWHQIHMTDVPHIDLDEVVMSDVDLPLKIMDTVYSQ